MEFDSCCGMSELEMQRAQKSAALTGLDFFDS
jgi:hypothetical protein